MSQIPTINVPTKSGQYPLLIELGRSLVIVGANGAGKTRLGVFIEDTLPFDKVMRIAAHRSLHLSDKLSAVSFDRAVIGLRTGYIDSSSNFVGNRTSTKYQQRPAVTLVDDFNFLLQALFAEQSRAAISHLTEHSKNLEALPPVTLLGRLVRIWSELLPHRKLMPRELDVQVGLPDTDTEKTLSYSGSDMSDGERVIFYMIGQCLLAPENSVIIVDEPELHIHKAILSKLWDTIEAERADCAFIYITHDLDFVTARPAAQKVYVSSYIPKPQWEVTEIPSDTGLSERLITELVGSRQPILFVEGNRESLDATIYRSVYSKFLVEPIGSCTSVIHAVSSFASHSAFHRMGCISGCVDGDARSQEEIDHLAKMSVYVLPVAEIENCLLMPDVFVELAKAMQFDDAEAQRRLRQLTEYIIEDAVRNAEAAAVRFASRRLDAELKKLGPNAKTIEDLTQKFEASLSNLNPKALAQAYLDRLNEALDKKELNSILEIYDNKGLLSIAAMTLGFKGREALSEFVARVLAAPKDNNLKATLRNALPKINAACHPNSDTSKKADTPIQTEELA